MKTLEKELIIQNKLGLHARAAAQFVKLANRYHSEVYVMKDSLRVNGKSILGVLTLAASCNSRIKVICEGEDANELIVALEELVNGKFQEE